MTRFQTLTSAAGLLAGISIATASVAQPFCLDSRNIHDSRTVNSRTIVFSMIDGKKYLAHLQQDCPGLNYNGFEIFPANSDQVCAGLQTIGVLQNHQVCQIGAIEPLPAPPVIH